MTETKSRGERTWEGDPSTVAEARAEYEKSPINGLIPLAMELYSHRRHEKFAEELVGLMDKLIDRARYDASYPVPDPEEVEALQQAADKADVLSTYLEWISRRKGLRGYERKRLLSAADDICRHGIDCARLMKQTGHTLPLLHLTAARINLDWGLRSVALSYLRMAQNAIATGTITDPNQLVRVYAKLGLLLRQCGEWGEGLVWGVRALRVAGVPRNVRLKALAALIGYDA